MTHALGCYYCPEHHRPEDRDYIAKLQPPVIRLLEPDVQQIADMHALAPGAIIAARIWSIDDSNGEAVRGLMADPVKTGYDHANRYADVLARWVTEASQRGLTLPPKEHIYFNAANEPNQGGTPDKIATYNLNFLQRCTELGIHATALCLGVGWPDNSGPDTPVNWTPYAELPDVIHRGGHWLELHEYFYKTGPQEGWTWWAGRHLQCPFDVPILLGEVGIDNYVDKARWDKEGGNRGWQGNVSPDQYADMIQWHISHSDTRVIAALPFLLDFRNREWASFDHNPANGALLARKESMRPQATPPKPSDPHTVYIPAAGSGSTPLYVLAKNGLYLRAEPKLDGKALALAPHGELVTALDDVDSEWVLTQYSGQTGYMYGSYLSANKPQPTPVEQPASSGDNWERALAFVRKWEGGWADDPNDAGGATNKGITLGTFTRWRQAHGQPAPTKEDLRTLTDAEANSIYDQFYWRESGADKLPWPLCLAHFDTAVNAGTGRAQEMLQRSAGSFLAYAGNLIDWYARIDGFEHFGRAWMRRRADLLIEASKP